jgi:hypothetical protein
MAPNHKRSVGQPRKLTEAEAAALKRQFAEAKKQAAEVVSAYRRLSPMAQHEFYNLLVADPATLVGRQHQVNETFRNIVNCTRAKYRRGPDGQHARTAARDAVIVQLRDDERLTFGKIPRRLRSMNAAWARKGGTPLSRDTVEKAYHRQKGRA